MIPAPTLTELTSVPTILASIAEALSNPPHVVRSGPVDRMIAIQAEAYPCDWPEADRREMAEIHLFGRNG